MDFFELQEDARRRTGVLVACYAAAVMLTIGAVYAVIVALLGSGNENGIEWWHAEIFLGVALILGILILGGSLFKVKTLSAGGARVASMLGAREISPDTIDSNEKRLINIVEEMAIAAGIPAPPVFVIENEEGINAFAAGFRPSDAVIGVTQGCMGRLSRDELQGVVAHEFSHILNGDMRLNIRLIGVLHGLLMINLLGLTMLRVMVYSGHGRSRRRSSGRTDGRVAMVIFVLGLAMTVIGAIGVLFGRLIKSAVSRQREHLADAAAVQFTRNPSGLAGALKKISGLSEGSRVRDPHAEELSHLFFANGLRASWLGLMATHPPLNERIRRLEPGFAGQADTGPEQVTALPVGDGPTAGVAGLAGGAQATGPIVPGRALPREISMRPEQITQSIGGLDAGQLDAARAMLMALPDAVREGLHHHADAAAAVLALLWSEKPEAAELQSAILENAGSGWQERVTAMHSALRGVDSSMRLAVVDLALPALQRMSTADYRLFRQMCHDFAAADGEISVFEYALLGVIDRYLARKFDKNSPPTIKYHALEPLRSDALVLLGVLARFGNEDDNAEAEQVFAAGLKVLDRDFSASIPNPRDCTLSDFDRALERFRRASLPLRKLFLQAGAACVAANGRVTVDEGNLLRAISDAFDVPMPPLIDRSKRSFASYPSV